MAFISVYLGTNGFVAFAVVVLNCLLNGFLAFAVVLICLLWGSEQELLASVDMEGAMESVGGSLCVDALSAKTFLF